MRPQLHTADVLDYAAAYTGEPYHAALLDPPYELGFMGKHWDASGIAFRAETWAAFLPLLHPGAFGMAFAGSRGLHRMMVAIEDAGFIIHPVIGWCYGSGFPKASRLDTQIDAAAGMEREVIGIEDSRSRFDGSNRVPIQKFAGHVWNESTTSTAQTHTAPATDLARAWAGHRYGLQALKPALEFIVVFQKPYAGRPVDSMVATGAGALWIDGARVGTDDTRRSAQSDLGMFGSQDQRMTGYRPHYHKENEQIQNGSTSGRWPANLVLSHAPECVPPDCVPGCAVAALGAQSGETVSGGGPNGKFGGIFGNGKENPNKAAGLYWDEGTAARYFFQAHYAAERLEAAEPLFYSAKASTAEREAGLSGRQRIGARPLGISQWEGQTNGSGETMGPSAPRANIHPTCKPLALARHLATLLLPPAIYAPRRLFIPFCGVASECIGAMQAGWEIVDGVELEADHVAIGRARIDFWAEQGVQLTLFDDV